MDFLTYVELEKMQASLFVTTSSSCIAASHDYDGIYHQKKVHLTLWLQKF